MNTTGNKNNRHATDKPDKPEGKVCITVGRDTRPGKPPERPIGEPARKIDLQAEARFAAKAERAYNANSERPGTHRDRIRVTNTSLLRFPGAKRIRPFTVFANNRGGWNAHLRIPGRPVIAESECVLLTRPNGTKFRRWDIYFYTPTVSTSLSFSVRSRIFFTRTRHDNPRSAIVNTGAAAWEAMRYGWLTVALSLVDSTLTYDSTQEGPDVVPLGVASAFVSVRRMAKTFRTSYEQAREWLCSIGCEPSRGPNGVEYVTLWSVELACLASILNSPLEVAAKLLKDGQEVYRMARKDETLRRLGVIRDSLWDRQHRRPHRRGVKIGHAPPSCRTDGLPKGRRDLDLDPRNPDADEEEPEP